MREVSLTQVLEELRRVGVKPGDGLLVHSAIQFLGRPDSGISLYFEALSAVLGLPAQGTLAVPAFNFGFARGQAYDPANTPAEGMGVFSEYVRQQPGAFRTPHPMQSLAIIGVHAPELAQCDTPSAFDPGSAFERMLELDFKLLLLGADIQAASIVHYSEQRAAVPYRYWKSFQGQIITPPDRAEKMGGQAYRMYVRDLDLDAHLDLHPIQHALQRYGQWSSTNLNYGTIALCRLQDFVRAADELLAADPWALVGNRATVLQRYQANRSDKQQIQ
ncbi:MAG TPA: AAC(3) family N-acetyltransferase [Anaerolineales bacterium]|nr:AAC(3) family N-acetyltransferase [Anaerolineales bacterium]